MSDSSVSDTGEMRAGRPKRSSGAMIAIVVAVIGAAATIIAALIQVGAFGGSPAGSTKEFPSGAVDGQVSLLAGTYYDIDGARASSVKDTETDFSLITASVGSQDARIRFAGEGKLVTRETANPAGCEASTLVVGDQVNIYGPGEGRIVCIRTTVGSLAIIRHLPGAVPDGGIVIGIQLYKVGT